MLYSDWFTPTYFNNDIKHLIAFCLINNCKTKNEINQLISQTTIPDGLGGTLYPLLHYKNINIEHIVEAVSSVTYEIRHIQVDGDHGKIVEIKLEYN